MMGTGATVGVVCVSSVRLFDCCSIVMHNLLLHMYERCRTLTSIHLAASCDNFSLIAGNVSLAVIQRRQQPTHVNAAAMATHADFEKFFSLFLLQRKLRGKLLETEVYCDAAKHKSRIWRQTTAHCGNSSSDSQSAIVGILSK